MKLLKTIIIAIFITVFHCSCGDDMTAKDSPKFESMLTYWADDIIIPAYAEYVSQVERMDASISSLVANPTIETLSTAEAHWLSAYTAWQSVSLYDIGMAEQIGLRNYTNIYPTDTAKVKQYARSGIINLELPSNMPVQGFPAIESLLFSNEGRAEALQTLKDNPAYGQYLLVLSERIVHMASLAADDWTADYRATFIAASGTSATASVNKIANDFLYYYERAVRANKVGIPAGIFSTSPLADRVEGRYANGTSKQLFIAALDATQSFFNGKRQPTDAAGEGFASYLVELNQGELANEINAQFDNARTIAEELNDDFEQQVLNDNTQMLALYDELQKAVILMKVDMMQAMNIKVDYIDADGD